MRQTVNIHHLRDKAHVQAAEAIIAGLVQTTKALHVLLVKKDITKAAHHVLHVLAVHIN